MNIHQKSKTLMRKQITQNRTTKHKNFNREYYLALQLYLINKRENKRVPTLPAGDFRRYAANQKVNKHQKYRSQYYFPSFSDFIKRLAY